MKTNITDLIIKALIYETVAFLIIYFVSLWYFGKTTENTLTYSIITYLVLCAYYVIFHINETFD